MALQFSSCVRNGTSSALKGASYVSSVAAVAPLKGEAQRDLFTKDKLIFKVNLSFSRKFAPEFRECSVIALVRNAKSHARKM